MTDFVPKSVMTCTLRWSKKLKDVLDVDEDWSCVGESSEALVVFKKMKGRVIGFVSKLLKTWVVRTSEELRDRG